MRSAPFSVLPSRVLVVRSNGDHRKMRRRAGEAGSFLGIDDPPELDIEGLWNGTSPQAGVESFAHDDRFAVIVGRHLSEDFLGALRAHVSERLETSQRGERCERHRLCRERTARRRLR